MSDTVPHSGLPIEESIGRLREVLRSGSHAVVVAPPGAGKTTIVPLRLLHEPWVAGKRIVMLEPRRLAARAAATRMASLLGERVGDTVGFQTRDERRIGPATRVEVVTEGVLTRRLQNDPSLDDVAVVLFDEIHERNLPTDLGLAFLLDALSTFGAATRIVAMSATAQAEVFSGVLGSANGPAPIIVSEGRQFPVEVRHLPRSRNDRLEDSVADAVTTALRESPEGDVLCFLPGIGEINRAQQVLTQRLGDAVHVVRLAGALPFEEQDAALRTSPDGKRRVVLSTDIAETSLTVDGVRIVVDAGLARVPQLNARTGLVEIVTVTSSRASADQRSGRAGRVAPGTAWRLWSKLEDATRLAHLPAEITQTDACALVLDVAAWGTPMAELRFLDVPPEKNLRLATETLRTLHLLDGHGRITGLGSRVLGLPLHPRLATMVVRHRDSPAEGWIACMVAALLEDRDIMRGRPEETPADLSLRVKAVADVATHDLVDRGGLRRVREAARDIARRAGIDTGARVTADMIDTLTGPVVLAAYPDRLAMRRSTPGQFVMRTGGAVGCDPKDPVAKESFIVAADVSSHRGAARVRMAAAVDLEFIAPVLGDDVEVMSHLTWDKSRDDLVMRVVRKVGNIRIDERDLPAVPGPDTTAALVERVAATGFAALGGGPATSLRQRIAFLRHHLGHDWPDTSNKHLLATVDEWLVPHLAGATCAKDLAALDMSMILQSMLGWDASARLEELVPRMYSPPRGRPVEINYADPDSPSISVRVQHLFGVRRHPTVLGGKVPLRVHLLSPADRPIQVTGDLPGFWTGSWAQVRKDMAGRYPKHDWPLDPSS